MAHLAKHLLFKHKFLNSIMTHIKDPGVVVNTCRKVLERWRQVISGAC